MQQLKLYLGKITSISSSDWNFFISKLQRRIITKKSVFIKVNQIENHISFI